MKKRLLAWFLLVAMVLTACVGCAGTQENSTGDDLTTGGQAEYPEIPAAEEPSIQIHYKRNDGAYDTWGFWIWEQGGEGAVYSMNYEDEFGGVAVYPLSQFGSNVLTKGIGIIPRMLDSWTKDCDSDRLLSFKNLVMDDNNYYHIYLTQGDEAIYMDENLTVAPAITLAKFSDMNRVVALTNAPIKHIALYENGVKIAENDIEDKDGGRCDFPDGKEVDFGSTYEIEVTFSEDGAVVKSAVALSGLYSTDAFNDAYYYDGELGAIYTKESTTFKVWSPVSSSIVLKVYKEGSDNGNGPIKTVEMTKGEKGVFSTTLEGDYAGKYYTYTVTNAQYPDGIEIVDPYAKSAGMSGVRGQIVDFDATDPEGWENVSPIAYDRKELVVWETHVADVTSSKTWEGTELYRKTFLGMIEEGTTYTENGVTVTTGFDHIKELGINAIQLIPIFDQANNEGSPTFNWGYNPLNYNVLEGSYSTNPRDGYTRITEFKQLVQAYNAEGINVIMDVVYNHVNSATGSNFDVLMPGYYFRYNNNGTLSNGSGCGNEMASENKMARKFIIDSVCFWAEEYNLGGFRFDLMGLHDIETMNEVAKALQQINPNIVIYGEPWTGGTSTLPSDQQSVQVNANKLNGVGQFNDQMRDALIKGGMNSSASKGWVTNTANVSSGDMNKILAGLKGITLNDNATISDPNRTLNYVTCHDNYTLYDRIKAAGITDEQTIEKMALLSNAVVLTSNGTTFMLAGEEFLRTKGGDHNSYASSYEVNELNYALKIQHQDLFEAYKTLIKFKIETGSLHLEKDEMSAYTATSLAGGSVIEITFHDEQTDRDYKIIHANGTVKDYTADFAGYTLVLDTIGGTTLSGATAIQQFQTIIAYK